MGCGASSSANAAVEPLLGHPSAASPPKTNENAQTTANGRANGVGPHSTANGTIENRKIAPRRQRPDNDPQWNQLWLAHKDMLLDPADVHATLQDLMANATNRLSDAEILFLQRKVRSIVRQSHLQTDQQSSGNGGKKKKNKRTSGTDFPATSILQELVETSTVAKEHHLMTAHVLRKLLPQPPIPNQSSNLEFLASNFATGTALQNDNTTGDTSSVASSSKISDSSIQTTEATYLLASFCNDTLWDNVAEIAVDSAKANDLDMDVNHSVQNTKEKRSTSQKNNGSSQQLPEPCEPTCAQRAEMPLGMGMHALTFILGLALRKQIAARGIQLLHAAGKTSQTYTILPFFCYSQVVLDSSN